MSEGTKKKTTKEKHVHHDLQVTSETLATRRTTTMFIRTLLWKNALLKRRHWIATLMEILLPTLFILLMGWLKTLTDDVRVPSGWSDADTTTSVNDQYGTSYNLFESIGETAIPNIPSSLPRYYMHETSMTGLLLALGAQSVRDGVRLDELPQDKRTKCTMGVAAMGRISLNQSSPFRVPEDCEGRITPYKIAIAPDTPFTRDYFVSAMDNWYPRIPLFGNMSIPSFRDSIEFFATTDDLETYVKSQQYGEDPTKPRIYGAIVFDTFPTAVDRIGTFDSIEYTLRLNSTRGRRGVTGMVPRTLGDPPALSPFQRSIEVGNYARYAVNGFMTLQTLVTRFVNCMPTWDPATNSAKDDCQRPQAISQPSPELDARLLSSLEDDAMIKLALESFQSSNEVGGNPSSALGFLPPIAKEALVRPLRQAPQPYLGAAVAPFPINEYVSSPFYDSVKNVFALVFILAYLYSISRILVVLIQEKETRLREYIKILGVNDRAIITAWYLTYFAIILIGTVLQSLAGLVGLFAHSSVVVVFLFFFLFGLSVLAFGFLISTIFSKARIGAFVGMVAFFLMYFVSSALTPQTSESSKSMACVLSPVALALGVRVMANLEATGVGVSFGNINIATENFRLSTSLWFFAFDFVLYTILGLYFDKVLPKEYGTTLPWYFPVSRSYWQRKKLKASLETQTQAPNDVIVDINPNIEPVGADLREQERTGQVLTVHRLRKVFSVPGGEKVAVKGLNLTMYKDQITCLLGHNGAGKTTLISMLTGMIPPTAGDAVFQGLSIRNDMDAIRESLGICFQHDVLFSELTVEEHLVFFGRIKGYSHEELMEAVDQQIQEVGLTEKRDVMSSALSGGMKRKLSVAVSLLGDSCLVFLDEPTSGMDPYSRRSTWEILLNNRSNRIMVLTTHFMDEADILGDRIAIMAEGELRCCGSSLFLKNRYGAGYNLTFVKDERAQDSVVMDFVTSFVPSAHVLSNVGSEIAFQLPLESSSVFADMFTALDRQLSELGLLSYGISVTTLEEVFIKVAEAGDEDKQHTLVNERRDVASPAMHSNEPVQVQGPGQVGFFVVHLMALLQKRFRVAKRDKKMLIYSTFLPVLLLLAGLALLKSSNITTSDPKLRLSTDAFLQKDQSPTPFVCQNPDSWWCETVLSSSFFSGAKPSAVAIPSPPYDSNEPTVFDVAYTNPKINRSDTTGYCLKLGEEIYKRGYGPEPVLGQYGAYQVMAASDRQIFGYNLLVNTTATHGVVIFKALMDQALYRFFASNTSATPSSNPIKLVVNSHPLPLTASTKALFGSFLSFTACLFICIAFSFFPASIVVFLVKEKQPQHNAKHQQLVSGVSLPAFWISNYVFDFTTYLVPFVLAVVLIKSFDIAALTGSSDCATCTSATFPSVVVLFFLFGLAICPFTYCLSYLFKDHASSQSYTIMINFVVGIVLMVVSFILDVIESTKDINKVLIFVWRLSPLFCLGNGLLRLSLNEIVSILENNKAKKSPFGTDLMGFEIMYLFLTAIVFGLVAVGLDYATTVPRKKKTTTTSMEKATHLETLEDEDEDQDEDVKREAARVRGSDNDLVKLLGLRKVYKGNKKAQDKVAVQNLSFGLQRGECFGFLGINGAGKTTTMKMLTGDILPTAGTATLGGFDILTQQMDVRRQIGYCPQFDALFELLTVREHLELYGRIKGVPAQDLDAVVDEKIQQLNLQAFHDKLAGSLSGGNKRKLSVAMAMIGNPPIMFLDEPSTGMDPVSRRFMWDVIASMSTRSKNSTIVLTTHSMEESEALCSRVGIMVGGRLRCLGSVQHLKNRFGDGLVFDVKLSSLSALGLEDLMEQHFTTTASPMFVTPMELETKCTAVAGDASFANRITPEHPTGYALANALSRDGFIRAEAFCSWCMEEVRFDALYGFLRQSFGDDHVMVMERQNDFCRFKLTHVSSLARVFALIENHKEALSIREYSVSQTTLEQIFNYFASQQNEEQGVARGMMV